MTVDWVVLTAGLVGLGLAVMTVVSPGVQNVSGDIDSELSSNIVYGSFAGLIPKQGFDSIETNDGQHVTLDIAGFSFSGHGGIFNPTPTDGSQGYLDPTTFSGDNVLYTNGGTLVNTTSEAYDPAATYRLDFSAGDRAGSHGAVDFEATIYAGSTAIGTYSGNTGDINALAQHSFSSDVSDANLAGETIRVEIAHTGGGPQLNLDDIALTRE